MKPTQLKIPLEFSIALASQNVLLIFFSEFTSSIVDRGHDLVKQGSSLMQDVKSSESAQALLGEGKKLVQNLKENEDVQKLFTEVHGSSL